VKLAQDALLCQGAQTPFFGLAFEIKCDADDVSRLRKFMGKNR
jgi:hypothetical protein